jgi:hypothetical protein
MGRFRHRSTRYICRYLPLKAVADAHRRQFDAVLVWKISPENLKM